MENFRFLYQENQFTGECLPCTEARFNTIVNSAKVDRCISTRQAIDKAAEEGLPLDGFISDAAFRNFCLKQEAKPRAGAAFMALPIEKKLQQWANNGKMWLPCFIFGVEAIEPVPLTDKDGNAVLGEQGQPRMFHRGLQQNITKLSGLFMFDGDHLPMDPREVFERTQVQDFPWKVLLAHKTSSGHGLRLVCEARPEVGNIADNQIELARVLGLLGMKGTTGKPVTDNSCIDACRISYAPRACDIYYIDKQHLFIP